MVQEDLLVNAVNALDSAVYLRRLGEVLRTETLCYARLDSLYELLALLLIAFENILDLGICIGIEVAERKILKLLLYCPDSETMCNGSVRYSWFQAQYYAVCRADGISACGYCEACPQA